MQQTDRNTDRLSGADRTDRRDRANIPNFQAYRIPKEIDSVQFIISYYISSTEYRTQEFV